MLKEQLKKNKYLNGIYDNFYRDNEVWINDLVKKEIKNDKEFYKKITEIFGGKINDQLIIDNLSSILIFKKDLLFCKKCPGFEKCNKDNRHYNWVLEKNNEDYLTCSLVPCRLNLEHLKLDRLYTFDEFNYLGPFRDFPFSWRFSQISKLDKSKSRFILIEEYKKIIDGKKKGLFICGSCRSGKSFVATTLLNNFIFLKKPKKVIFINCVDRIKYLKEIYFNNKDEFDNLIKLYSNVEILVLDDFGKEYKKEFTRDNIVIKILDCRIRNNLVTIFTSNFNYDELSKIYSINNFGKIYGEQLKEMLINFAGNEIDISTVSIY